MKSIKNYLRRRLRGHKIPKSKLFSTVSGRTVFDISIVDENISDNPNQILYVYRIFQEALGYIGDGEKLSNYDNLAIAAMNFLERATSERLSEYALGSFANVAGLYSRFSKKVQKSYEERIKDLDARTQLVIEVSKMLGPGYIKADDIEKVRIFLSDLVEAIRQNAWEDYLDTQHPVIFTQLSIFDMTFGYTYLLAHLREWGEDKKAIEIAVKVLCMPDVYFLLKPEERVHLRERLKRLFPSEFPKIKNELLDYHENFLDMRKRL